MSTFVLRLSLALAVAPPVVAQSLGSALATFVADPNLAGARVGVHVVDGSSGETLAAHDPEKGFMTASNMKLVTSITALSVLGPDFVFETALKTAAPLEDGTLAGDVYLIGSGDPTLGARQEKDALDPFVRMALSLRTQGITRIEGRVIGVDDIHADEVMGKGWQWDYQSAGYAAQISGLCFAENVAKFHVEGTETGKPPQTRVVPDIGYVLLTLGSSTDEEGVETDLRVERRRASNTVAVRGSIAPGQKSVITGSVENPTRYAAAALRRALSSSGIVVSGRPVDFDDLKQPMPERLRTLSKVASSPLGEIVVTLNKVSQNLYAEQFLRAAGAKLTGEGSLNSGVQAVHSVFERFGVDRQGLAVEDGSGLTRRNLVQPRHLTGLLLGAWRSDFREVLTASLPVAGIDGTLAKRYPEGSPARGKVLAKTGYISRVVALSGYVPREGREPVVFSILVNNFTCATDDAKAAVDRFVNALADL